MILPKVPQTTAAVAAHYDDLDAFYREVWGDHVHHGYWATGRETPAEAAEALVDLLADRLDLRPGLAVVDIGCGYGETARRPGGDARGIDVTGLTVSSAQADYAATKVVAGGGRPTSSCGTGWRTACRIACFDRAYAIESSEHMPDKQRFFDEAFRVLRPGGVFGVYAWLAKTAPNGLGRCGICWSRSAARAGCRAWAMKPTTGRWRRQPGSGWSWCRTSATRCAGRGRSVCAGFSGKLVTEARYRRFLLERSAENRVFALTLARLLLAYRTRSMRYCLLVLRK